MKPSSYALLAVFVFFAVVASDTFYTLFAYEQEYIDGYMCTNTVGYIQEVFGKEPWDEMICEWVGVNQ